MARRHAPEQIIAKVRQGQKMLNDGHPMIEVVNELQVTEATWYRWLNQYGSEKNAEASNRTVRLFVPVFSDFLTVTAWRRENAGAGSSQCS